jgi:hypothetical protein
MAGDAIQHGSIRTALRDRREQRAQRTHIEVFGALRCGDGIARDIVAMKFLAGVGWKIPAVASSISSSSKKI